MTANEKKTFVLDTNVILHDYRSIYNFTNNDIVIPIVVLEELDKFKKGNDLINFHAREFARELDKISEKDFFDKGAALGKGRGRLFIQPGVKFSQKMKDSFSDDTPDHRILAVTEYISEKMKIVPIIYGGGQQKGMRSGTDNVPGIAGLGAAAADCYKDFEEKQKKLKKLRIRNIILNLVCICLAGSGLWWTATYFWRYVNYEVTNDAFVDQYVAPLNVRASGYIKEVCFKEHQYVRQGDTLLVLDNREYQIKVKEAEAALLDVHGSQEVLHSGIETAHTNIAVQDANIAEAKTKLWQLEQDYHRFERLLKEESVPEQQFEQTKAAYEAAKARYQALVAQKQSVLSQYTETSKKTTSAEAAILRKEADLDLAKLNLSYTVLIAPYDGYMGRRTLEPGQYVQTGQTISYLVRNKDKWITANYKETQIANIYIGQQVRIKVDAVPGKIFHGEVTAISEATGSKYSLVPTDNSAGNFVKVQQRIPVRIELEDVSSEEMAQLRAGMMVETEALRK